MPTDPLADALPAPITTDAWRVRLRGGRQLSLSGDELTRDEMRISLAVPFVATLSRTGDGRQVHLELRQRTAGDWARVRLSAPARDVALPVETLPRDETSGDVIAGEAFRRLLGRVRGAMQLLGDERWVPRGELSGDDALPVRSVSGGELQRHGALELPTRSRVSAYGKATLVRWRQDVLISAGRWVTRGGLLKAAFAGWALGTMVFVALALPGFVADYPAFLIAMAVALSVTGVKLLRDLRQRWLQLSSETLQAPGGKILTRDEIVHFETGSYTTERKMIGAVEDPFGGTRVAAVLAITAGDERVVVWESPDEDELVEDVAASLTWLWPEKSVR